MPCINTVQGFYFCLVAIQPHISVYSSFCTINASYTTKTPKLFTGLYRCISVDLPHSSAHNTAATQAAYTPTVPRWRAYPQAQHLHRYRITPTHRTLCKPAQPPIIIMYIGVLRCVPVIDLCQAIQHSADRASQAASRYFSRPAAGVLAWVSLALAWHYVFSWHGGRNLWRLPPHLFSGFRPIANRGQQ